MGRQHRLVKLPATLPPETRPVRQPAAPVPPEPPPGTIPVTPLVTGRLAHYAILAAHQVPRAVIVELLCPDRPERLDEWHAREEVRETIRQIVEKRRARPEDIVAWLTALAKADPRAIFDEQGRIRPPSTWSAELAVLVQQYTETRQGPSVKFIDRVRVLELLGKHLGVFRDRVDRANILARAAGIPPERIAELTDEEISRAVEAARFLDALCRRFGVGDAPSPRRQTPAPPAPPPAPEAEPDAP